jgi:YHS domain-containing protein
MLFAFIERLILIMIALSAVRSVVRFLQGLGGGAAQTRWRMNRNAAAQTTGSRTAQPAMLQQDPVCGTYVAIDSSLKRVVNGKVLHFCSDDCRDKYRG